MNEDILRRSKAYAQYLKSLDTINKLKGEETTEETIKDFIYKVLKLEHQTFNLNTK